MKDIEGKIPQIFETLFNKLGELRFQNNDRQVQIQGRVNRGDGCQSSLWSGKNKEKR